MSERTREPIKSEDARTIAEAFLSIPIAEISRETRATQTISERLDKLAGQPLPEQTAEQWEAVYKVGGRDPRRTSNAARRLLVTILAEGYCSPRFKDLGRIHDDLIANVEKVRTVLAALDGCLETAFHAAEAMRERFRADNGLSLGADACGALAGLWNHWEILYRKGRMALCDDGVELGETEWLNSADRERLIAQGVDPGDLARFKDPAGCERIWAEAEPKCVEPPFKDSVERTLDDLRGAKIRSLEYTRGHTRGRYDKPTPEQKMDCREIKATASEVIRTAREKAREARGRGDNSALVEHNKRRIQAREIYRRAEAIAPDAFDLPPCDLLPVGLFLIACEALAREATKRLDKKKYRATERRLIEDNAVPLGIAPVECAVRRADESRKRWLWLLDEGNPKVQTARALLEIGPFMFGQSKGNMALLKKWRAANPEAGIAISLA